jgi:hypothetical protein|tara:strand:+ start:1846 stop:2055 length:210 start_codon:yes stop_codon:yes gene_type:complete
MFSKECKLHLKTANMTAIQHMVHALKIALKLQLLVPVIIIHSVAPRVFTTTASDTMKRILDDNQSNSSM